MTVGNPLTHLGLPSPLILGSGSFTRKLILQEMGIPYVLKVRPIDEKNIGDRSYGSDPRQLVLTLAKAKADHLAHSFFQEWKIENESNRNLTPIVESDHLDYNSRHGHIILTADQVVTHEKHILEKPNNIEEAVDFVKKYAFSPPSTVGAVVLTHIPSMIQVSGTDTAQINFKSSVADCNLIDRLLQDGAPVLQCAGGLMVEHPLVREHIESIDGTEDSVMGLSKDCVLRLLEELSVRLPKSSF